VTIFNGAHQIEPGTGTGKFKSNQIDTKMPLSQIKSRAFLQGCSNINININIILMILILIFDIDIDIGPKI